MQVSDGSLLLVLMVVVHSCLEQLVHIWLETTLHLTQLSENSAEKAWSSLQALEVTMFQR